MRQSKRDDLRVSKGIRRIRKKMSTKIFRRAFLPASTSSRINVGSSTRDLFYGFDFGLRNDLQILLAGVQRRVST